MKRAIALGLLTVLLVMGIGSVSVSQDELSPDRFATFADWCHHHDRLTSEAQHTVETLLEEAGTQECNQAEDRLTHLIELDLNFKQIVDVAPLATLTNLTELDLWNNEIVDVLPLARLTNLTRLSLAYNQIEDVSPLAHLTNLTALFLNENEIADVSPLATLTNLTGIYLPANLIADVSSLATLTNLVWLYLSDNPLENRTCPVQPEAICQF